MSVFMPVRRRALTAKLSLLLATMAAVCLGQFPPPSDSGQYAAKVLTMTGQVSVLKDTVLYGLVDGSTVKVQEMIVTGPDGHATFQVSDGSTFEVFPNSHLVFRKNAWNVKDLIDLLVGRIRVHIEHIGNVPNPNRVLTPTAVISVRGTTFDVTVDDNDETTTVEVTDGLVEVRHALLPSDGPKMLGPGDVLKVYRSQPIAQNRWDKGTVAHFAFKTLMDAVNVASIRFNRGVLGTSGSGSGGGSAPGAGDSGKPAPPTLPTGPLGPSGGHYASANAQPAHHHGTGAAIRTAAKRTVEWLGKVTGVTALVKPVVTPIDERLLLF
jgi:ferric-dicitrate binding protein FerR (iron transport regulator)